MGGEPMKSATNMLGGPVVDILRRADLLDHAAHQTAIWSAMDIASSWSCVT